MRRPAKEKSRDESLEKGLEEGDGTSKQQCGGTAPGNRRCFGVFTLMLLVVPCYFWVLSREEC